MSNRSNTRTRSRHRARTLSALLALAALVVPASLSAQDAGNELGREELTVFARAHLDMNEARDAFHAAIAAAHEEQAIERAREELDRRIAEIFEEHPLTRERYDQVVLIISVDEGAREALAEIMRELAPESVGQSG